MTYKLHPTSPELIIRIADDATIPLLGGNADADKYFAWTAEGNTPAPALTTAEDKVRRIDLERAKTRKRSPQISDGVTYSATTDDLAVLNAMVDSFATLSTAGLIEWQDIDENSVFLTQAQMKAVRDAVAAQIIQANKDFRAAKTDIENEV